MSEPTNILSQTVMAVDQRQLNEAYWRAADLHRGLLDSNWGTHLVVRDQVQLSRLRDTALDLMNRLYHLGGR